MTAGREYGNMGVSHPTARQRGRPGPLSQSNAGIPVPRPGRYIRGREFR